MDFKTRINIIFQAFDLPLPGKQAHKELAPYRNEIELDFKNKNPKIASTLLLIYPRDGKTFFCLIERQEYEGTHSNQISFPGGKNESGESLKETALRETKEEIGVDPISINIIGELTQVFVPPSNFLIHPFVGYCNFTPVFNASEREVKRIIEVNIEDLFKKDVIKIKKMSFKKISGNVNYEVPYLDLNNKIVWGATSVILNEFRKMLQL
ncbi:MAG: NUDIX hydrolase [Parvicellaceae bacterium]